MKHFIKKLWFAIFLPFAANIFLICHMISLNHSLIFPVLLGLVTVGIWLYININPFRDDNYIGLRLRIMMGGRMLCFCAVYGLIFQTVIIFTVYRRLAGIIRSPESLIIYGILAYIVWLLILWNGILRIFFTSRRLSLSVRLFMLLAMWVPVLNLIVLLYALSLVHAEYDFACYKDFLRNIRVESDMCRTKYPIVMVHGIGFRDLKYFNYWGRIPRELTRYGASISYGNQEALGTIAVNAEDICQKIFEVLKETGCTKVNIIAHSKGGLDSRYAISKLHMAPYVASLTTISTPHRGCRFVDYACKLPDGLYRLVAHCFDKTFTRLGDKRPDFYTATHQFSTYSSQTFNDTVPDVPEVYYQSYASKMKKALSDPLLCIPYCLIKPLEGDNDGLVSINSAKWGEFKGVFSSPRHRGISHGDMIDLKREDYKGFDVVEEYVQIVSDLKARGY